AGRDQRKQRAEHQPVECLRNEICPVDHFTPSRIHCPQSARPACRLRARFGIDAESAPFQNTSGPELGTYNVLKPSRITKRLGVVAEMATERVRLLHQRSARN